MEATGGGEFAPEEAFAEAIRRAVPDPARAEAAAAAVLCALVRRIPAGRAHEVASRLPLRLRRLVATCPAHRPGDSPRGGLAADVAEHLSLGPEEAAGVVRAVLRAARGLAGASAAEVERALPPEVRPLWRGEEGAR